MLNLNAVSGVKSTPLSKNILENSLGSNSLKDSRAFANYEFLVNSLTDSNFRAPSVLLASGDGSFYPKTASYQNNFYSSNILGRDGFMNIWQSNYLVNENYSITYYDGYSLFKRFTLEYNTGKALLKSLELRNGNTASEAGLSQLIFGHNLTPAIDEIGLYRHSIRTRHDITKVGENCIDFFLWNPANDSAKALGSRRVVSLNSAGNLEIVNGCQVDGGISLAIDSASEKTAETESLAISGKGVMYYNSKNKKYRYSEDGAAFKDLGSGSSSTPSEFYLESCNLNKCIQCPPPSVDEAASLAVSTAIAVRLHSHKKARIKKIYVPSGWDNAGLKIAVYSDVPSLDRENSNFTYDERLIAYNGSYGGNGNAGLPAYWPLDVNVETPSWKFYNRENTSNSETEAIVSGNFTIVFATSVSGASSEYIVGEQLVFNQESIPGFTGSNNSMNFSFVIYRGEDQYESDSSYNYPNNSINESNIKFSIPPTTSELTPINYIPYVKVVLEAIED